MGGRRASAVLPSGPHNQAPGYMSPLQNTWDDDGGGNGRAKGNDTSFLHIGGQLPTVSWDHRDGSNFDTDVEAARSGPTDDAPHPKVITTILPRIPRVLSDRDV